MSLLRDLATLNLPPKPWALGQAVDEKGEKIGIMLELGHTVVPHPKNPKKLLPVQQSIIFKGAIQVVNVPPKVANHFFDVMVKLPDLIEVGCTLTQVTMDLVKVVCALRAQLDENKSLPEEVGREIDRLVEQVKALTDGEQEAPQQSMIVQA